MSYSANTISASNNLISISIINFFVVIGLLRLTNFNYYLSQLAGLETSVNATGGDAFNFINYVGFSALVIALVGKAGQMRMDVKGYVQFGILGGIYVLNAILAPFTNFTWVLYQAIFLSIALLLYSLTRSCSSHHSEKFYRGTIIFYWVAMIYLLIFTVFILSKYSLAYYFTEFNDAFVNSLNEFGIMKQRHGYLLGFLLAFSIFCIHRKFPKLFTIILILLAGVGIRSFVLGCLGALIVFSIHKKIYRLFWLIVLFVFVILGISGEFNFLIYDTRYYPFLNAFNIIQEFPFGVGLGGYPTYTEQFSNTLFAQLYESNSVLDYVPNAPESDLVHLFGSLGLLFGLIHLAIQFRLVALSSRFSKYLTPFEKCILFYFSFMTFFGISEDSIFSINYWIFFGIAAGIISNVISRVKMEK